MYKILTLSVFITEILTKLKTENSIKMCHNKMVMVYKLLNVQSMEYLWIFKNVIIREYVL